MVKQNRINQLIELLIGIDAFFTMSPYLLWETYSGYRIFDTLKLLVEVAALLLVLLSNQGIIRASRRNIWLAGSFLVVAVYYTLNAYPGTLSIGVGVISKYIVILLFLIRDSESKQRIFQIFLKIFALSVIPGIICCIALFIGINLPATFLQSIQEIKNTGNVHYRHIFGCVFREFTYYVPRFRQLCGMFDEPGMVGTVSALLLCGAGFDFKKNKFLYVILIAGILSMSFAFFLMLIIYYALSLAFTNRIKKRHVIIALGVAGILFAFRDNELLQKYLFNKISVDKLLDNNRTSDEFDLMFSEYLKEGFLTGKILLGYGNNNPIYHTVDVASYKVLIYNFGIVGFVLIVGWFAGWAVQFSKRIKPALILSCVFLLSIYQRPWIIYLYFIVILFGGIENLRYKSQDMVLNRTNCLKGNED